MQPPGFHLFEEQAALKNTILLTTVHYATKHFIKNENERRENIRTFYDVRRLMICAHILWLYF